MPVVKPTERECDAVIAAINIMKANKDASIDILLSGMKSQGFTEQETRVACGMIRERYMRKHDAVDEAVEEAIQ